MTASPEPAPLVFGHGPTEVEFFLEVTCPYSKRAFEKLPALVAALGENRVTVKIRLHSQPWHLFSGVITRAVLAASTFGRDAGLKAMAGIYARREAFEFEEHCSGDNMDRTPRQIIADIAAVSGVDVAGAFCLKSVDKALRWHTRYARQNGVHVSPSFAINGMLEPTMGSGQTVEEWAALITPHLAPAG